MHYLEDFVIILLVAVVVSVLSSRLKLPSVTGLLVTGVLVGPGGLGWVSSTENVENLAELGVVFLLFIVGLEISRDRLRSLARIIVKGGSAQSLLTLGLAIPSFLILEYSLSASLLLSFILCLSSTAVLLSLYFQRKEMDSPQGKPIVGILLFQDFLVVPLLVLLPLLAGKTVGTLSELALSFVTGIGFLALTIVVGRWVLPLFLKISARRDASELMVLSALLACLGASIATEHMGFSHAMGSFLAGMLIAETDFRYQVFATLKPFRDLFQSLFFISIGMLFHVESLWMTPWAILIGLLLVWLIKATAAIFAVRFLRFPFGTSFIAGLGLAHVGEFGFVLLREGVKLNILSEQTYQIGLSVSVISLFCAPLMVSAAPYLVRGRKLSKVGESEGGHHSKYPLQNHVVIIGYGLNGRNLAQVLKQSHLEYCVIEVDGKLVRRAIHQGEKIVFGDGSVEEVLLAAGAEDASIIAFTALDPRLSNQGVKLARQLNPSAHIIARAKEMRQLDLMKKLGANEVLVEGLETSIEIATRVLHRSHVPMNLIRTQARLLRSDNYQMLRRHEPGPAFSEQLLQVLGAGTVDTFMLNRSHVATGKTLEDCFRGKDYAKVIAVVRQRKTHPNPILQWRFEAGDILVLMGTHVQMERTWEALEKSKDPIPEI